MVRAASAADRTGSDATSAVSGVATKPGTIALQHTPRDAQASDWDLVSPASPAFAAPYPPLVPNARTDCWEAILRIRPQQAVRAFGNSGGYGAAKAGLAGLTRSQSEAWAPRGVCCNAIVPGFVATPLTAEVAADPVRSAALAARTMTGRNGEPADFEGVAVFLASRASDYVTGQMIFVDGGLSAA